MVLRRWTLSANSGSRCRELTRAYSVFWQRKIVSRLSRSDGWGTVYSTLHLINLRKIFVHWIVEMHFAGVH
jgi:hypothetical protein